MIRLYGVDDVDVDTDVAIRIRMLLMKRNGPDWSIFHYQLRHSLVGERKKNAEFNQKELHV